MPQKITMPAAVTEDPAWQNLSLMQQHVLELFFASGLRIMQIADELAISGKEVADLKRTALAEMNHRPWELRNTIEAARGEEYLSITIVRGGKVASVEDSTAAQAHDNLERSWRHILTGS